MCALILKVPTAVTLRMSLSEYVLNTWNGEMVGRNRGKSWEFPIPCEPGRALRIYVPTTPQVFLEFPER